MRTYKFKYIHLGILFLSVHSYADDTVNETSKAIAAVAACSQSTTLNTCLGDVSEKEENNYKAAYSAVIKSLVDIGNNNGPKLARELRQSKTLWESSLQHDCAARGLIYDDGSEAYEGNVAACQAVHYAQRVDFYNDFGISVNAKKMKDLLKEYNAIHSEK